MPARNVSGVTLGQFFAQVLKGLGVPVTTNNLAKLGAVAAQEGHGGDYNPFNKNSGPGTDFNYAHVKSYPDVATGVDQTIKLLRQSNTKAMLANLAADGPYNGWTSAVSNFYHSWGGGSLNISQPSAMNKLQGQIDGPKVVTNTSWLSAPSGSGTSFDVGAGQAKAGYDPADPLGWKQIAAGIAAGRINPDGSSTSSYTVPEAKPPPMNATEERSAFDAYLKSVGPDEAAKIIGEIKQGRSLEELSQYMAGAPAEVNRYINFLSTLDTPGVSAEQNMLAAPDPQGSAEMTNLLNTLGVSYPNAPQPTPALLAFLRGVGLNMSTAEDVKKRALDRIGAATSDAMADIDRTAGRTKQNITADLIRRNIVSSGESNTRYARQAEDVAKQQTDVQTTRTNSSADVSDVYNQTVSLARQQALDRVIGAEQDQATAKASSAAQEDAYRRQQAAAEESFRQQQVATQTSVKQQEDLLAKQAAQGFAQ